MVTRTSARPFAACGWWAVVVVSLRSVVSIVVILAPVQWMLYQIGNIRYAQVLSKSALGANYHQRASPPVPTAHVGLRRDRWKVLFHFAKTVEKLLRCSKRSPMQFLEAFEQMESGTEFV